MNQQEISKLRERTAEIETLFDDGVFLNLSRVTDMSLTFSFDWVGIPDVEPMDKYLALNYDCSPVMVPGLVRCESIEEAYHFLDLVKERAPELPDYERVLRIASGIAYEGLASAANAFSDGWDPESLPCEVNDAPYWHELNNKAEFVTTAGWSNPYGPYRDIPVPEEEASLLVKVIADIGSENEVELAGILDAWKVPEDSLEEFLVLQLVCHNNTPYAYIRYDIMAGIWLLPRLENEEFLNSVGMKSPDFKGYAEYRHGYDGLPDAITEWREAAKEYEN